MVGIVARLSPEKGVDIALRVHQAVVKARPGARLVILGEGPERKALGALAKQLGITDSVTWMGYQQDPSSLYRAMDVLLISSRSEGLPQVALEAMAHGLPVVATSVGGLPEVVEDGRTGFLATQGDVAGLAAHVLRLLAHPDLRTRLGDYGRSLLDARFSLAAKVDALALLYRELCT
jgi:glycosyltransferase involved in cell wall biosynthesis